MANPPLSTPLSHLLVAFTIELDNEFERRMAEAAETRPFRVSVVMWANFLRVVGEGITVGSLPAAVGLPKARVLSTIGGMERWRYVDVWREPRTQPSARRDGYGSARALPAEWVVRPTEVGRAAQEIWPSLFGEIERRWEERFGVNDVRELRRALTSVVDRLDTRLPEYLPVVAGANGMAAEVAAPEAQPTAPLPLSAVLSQVLLAYTLEFEEESALSLPLHANVVRVLDTSVGDVRDLPAASGVSNEAISMALNYLTKNGFAETDRRTKIAGLTQKGADARESARAVHSAVLRDWSARFGDAVDRLEDAASAVLEQRDSARLRLALGLHPHPDGWRASSPYRRQTQAILADPVSALPAYPMVLHRGGWPDGS